MMAEEEGNTVQIFGVVDLEAGVAYALKVGILSISESLRPTSGSMLVLAACIGYKHGTCDTDYDLAYVHRWSYRPPPLVPLGITSSHMMMSARSL